MSLTLIHISRPDSVASVAFVETERNDEQPHGIACPLMGGVIVG
jgi:hypothetical protein